MSDSDNDFIDDDELPTRGARAKKPKRAAWEASIHDRENPLIAEQTGVGLIEELAWKAEAKKRERLATLFIMSKSGLMSTSFWQIFKPGLPEVRRY